MLVLGILAALLVVGLLGALAAQRLAEQEALNDAANTADVLADAVIQPELTDALADGDPAAALEFDAIIRERVLGPGVVRVKIWAPDGTVLYADEPELMGRTFPLGEDQRIALADPQTRAEVSDLTASENEFEAGDRLLEVYRPVWTPGGRELLFELYSPYAPVQARTAELWRGFGGVTLSSLLLLIVLTAPIVWGLLRRVRADDTRRAGLLQHAVDASEAERRRIAGTLHDGPVQELVATSFAIERAAASAAGGGRDDIAVELRDAAASVRGNVRALRTLLVDIHPPGLAAAGLAAALSDLADAARSRGVDATVRIADGVGEPTEPQAQLIHRVAQECLRNAATHAAPCRVAISLVRTPEGLVLEVADDGAGFDPAELEAPREGHLGTRVMRDLAADAGAGLSLATAPGAGTAWRLVVADGPNA